MKYPVCVTNRKHSASFRIVSSMLAIAPLWLMLAAAGTSAHAQTSRPPSPADWTEFHRDNMQRWNPYETVLGIGNVGSLQVKWKYHTARLIGFGSSPAVVNGVVYFGSGDGNVYALNVSTGAKLWSYDTGNEVLSSPAVANGVVYFGSLDNNMYAVDATTGAKLWSYPTGWSVSPPTVANGLVYLGAEDSNIYALNASTGALVWKYATGGQVNSSPAVANGVVYFGSTDDNVYALNASTGALIWKYAPGNEVPSSPAVANGLVYISSIDGKLYALNASTGAMLWSFATRSRVDSSPAVANGVVYIGSDDWNLYALNANTGAKLWSYNTGNSVDSSPAVANGVVYVSSGNGYVFALNASTGAKLWSYDAGGHVPQGLDSSPTIVDGVVYILGEQVAESSSSGGNFYAFALGSADLFLRVTPSATTIHQGDLLTYAFPVWNLGPDAAVHEVLKTQVPAGTTFDYIRISGTPGLGTCTTPPYQGAGQIVCHENGSMAPNTTWTVRLTVRVTAPSGTVIAENAATMADTPDPNLANDTPTVSLKVQ
jgi:outer membrane protein assembly factor BamB